MGGWGWGEHDCGGSNVGGSYRLKLLNNRSRASGVAWEDCRTFRRWEPRWRKWATEGGSWVLQPWPLPVLFLRVQCDLSLLLLCRACPFVIECVARVGPNRPLSPWVVLVRVFITTSGKLTRTWLTTISPDQEVRASLFSLSSLSWKKQTAEEGAHLSDTASTHSLDCSLRVEKYEHLRILVLMKTAMRTLPFDPGPVYFRNAAQNYFWVCLHGFIFLLCALHAEPLVVVTDPYIFLLW